MTFATVLLGLLVQVPPPPAQPAPHRPTLHAPWVDARRLVLDGDPGEWTQGREPDARLERAEQLVNLGAPPTELWSGPDDASLRLWLGWNETDLVLGGLVRDEVADYDATNWFRGDSLELFLGLSAPTPEWKSDDFQLMLAPDWPERPWGVYPHGDPGEVPSDGGFGGVEVSSWPFEGGYRFEARIPWRNLRATPPAAGDPLTFNFALSDRDGRGRQESYLTWSAERDIAVWADRRGFLVLDPPAPGALAAESLADDGTRLPLPSLMLVLLVAMYALALATRRAWRTPSARRRGLTAAAVLLSLSLAAVIAARYQTRHAKEQRVEELSAYWRRFETLLRSGALGHPEAEALQLEAQSLLAGKAITPHPEWIATHLAPAGATLLAERATAQRALPFRPIVPEGRSERDPAEGVLLDPGEKLELELGAPLGADALTLVLRVSDRRFLRAGSAPVAVLAVDLMNGEEVVVTRDVRHRQDLHLDEDEHRDHPGLEPAFLVRGGPLGQLHGDGLLLDLGVRRNVDRLRIRHLGSEQSYAVQVVAAALMKRDPRTSPPPGLRVTASGEWEWADWRAGIEAEIAPVGRAPKRPAAESFARDLRLGSDVVANVWLQDALPATNPTRWDFLPILVAAALAPFLVAILAEWLSRGRHIRTKLALGFAITSAVPLLVLTLLLEASLGQEHETYETERVESLLTRAQVDLEREQRELESEARRLLNVAQWAARAKQHLAASSEELSSSAWWGEGEPGVVRLFEYIESDGRRVRVGSGPGWRQIPKSFAPAMSGLARPWGQLMVCGVAQTASGAEQPMSVIVARPARLATSGLRLVGAERDPRPSLAELADDAPRSPRELRRGLFARDGTLAAVLVAERRERGVPVFGDYSLNELLLAAGLTALFTATLFAGILTGHIVAPIERLDRAVRQGRTTSLPSTIEVEDEVGHLTGAVQSFAAMLEHRVRQLEQLRTAQEDLSSHLDAELAREAVLDFFHEHTQAASLWLVWGGETGEEERLFGRGGRNLAVPEGSALFERSLCSLELFDLRSAAELGDLARDDAEALAILGPCERVISLPLLAGGNCRGAVLVALQSRETSLDLAFLRTAASQSAIVLENARLYHQAVTDSVTGFLSDPGFKQRFSEEIQRCDGVEEAGVLVVALRVNDLPADDARAHARLREAARRMRLAVRGLAVFGRSGSADLRVALPWSGARPDFAAIEARIVERVRLGAWPDGELVGPISSSHCAWPDDGASGRLVLHLLDERIGERPAGLSEQSLASVQESLPVDFVAKSPLMLELLDTVRRVAEREVTLLIAGETGVGKDRIGKLVHAWSPRRDGPLVHVHCPSLSTTLIEDELFGHEVGAFTGASSRRVGPFEYARGGTLVLDEVAGLPPAGQVALLRLLETREVLPLGATRPVPLDVRIVATTSADLASEVERGRFRSDLYFRLNVAQISVPPLRLRRQDLTGLVEAYLRRHNASAARPVTGVSPAVLDLFVDHAWPGNLRELENVLSRGFILAAGTELSLEHVELHPEADGGPGRELPPLNDRQAQALSDLTVAARISSTEYAERHGISSRTGLRDLLDLVEQGYLSREGSKRGTRFRRTGKAWALPRGQ